MKLTKSLLNLLHPALQWIGKIHAPYSHKIIDGGDYKRVKELIRIGDTLITKTHGELSSLIIPSKWKHAAIYYGQDMIVEATQNGVVMDYLTSFMLHKDEIKILRPTFLTADECIAAAYWAEDQIGAAYDFSYEDSLKAFYCSELVRFAYTSAWINKPDLFPFELRIRAGIATVSPDDFDKAKTKFAAIYDSNEFHSR